MDRLLSFAAIALIALSTYASAAPVTIIAPYNATIQGDGGSIYLGKVGPGETFYVTISATTTNSTGAIFNLGWSSLQVSALPQGWIAQNSSLYTSQLSAKIAVAPNARNGTYSFNLTASNAGNYSKLGSTRFRAYVNVTPDVFKLSVSPTSISTGPGEPAKVYVSINNTGVSDSPFVISARNLPAWNGTSTVIALHGTTGSFAYPLYEGQPGVYRLNIYVNSISSPLVYKQTNVTLTTQASLANDYAAIGDGALTYPIIYEPAYAVMYLINLIFNRH